MRVVRLRVHVAVADRRKRLDREIEEVAEAARPRISDRILTKEIKCGVNGVDGQKRERRRGKEPNPGDGQRSVVEVPPEITGQSAGEEVARAEANLARAGFPSRRPLTHIASNLFRFCAGVLSRRLLASPACRRSEISVACAIPRRTCSTSSPMSKLIPNSCRSAPVCACASAPKPVRVSRR